MKKKIAIGVAVLSPFALQAAVQYQKGDTLGAGVGLVLGLVCVAVVL